MLAGNELTQIGLICPGSNCTYDTHLRGSVTLEFFLYRAPLRFLLGSCIVGNQDLFHLAEKSPSRTSGSCSQNGPSR